MVWSQVGGSAGRRSAVGGRQVGSRRSAVGRSAVGGRRSAVVVTRCRWAARFGESSTWPTRPAEARGSSDRWWDLPRSRPSRRRSSGQVSGSRAPAGRQLPVPVRTACRMPSRPEGLGMERLGMEPVDPTAKGRSGAPAHEAAWPAPVSAAERGPEPVTREPRSSTIPPAFALRATARQAREPANLRTCEPATPRPRDPATPRPRDPATPRPATPRPREPATPRPRDPATPRPRDPATPRPATPRPYDAPDPRKVVRPAYLNRASCCQIVSAASVPKNSVDQTSVATRHGAGLIASGSAPRLSTISRNE